MSQPLQHQFRIRMGAEGFTLSHPAALLDLSGASRSDLTSTARTICDVAGIKDHRNATTTSKRNRR